MTEKNDFYVYVYLDPRKQGKFIYDKYTFCYEPFYVGKGNQQRFTRHMKEASFGYDIKNGKRNYKCNKIRKIKEETGGKPIIIKYKDGITENEAFNIEKYLIKIIGRNDLGKGPLTNNIV